MLLHQGNHTVLLSVKHRLRDAHVTSTDMSTIRLY